MPIIYSQKGRRVLIREVGANATYVIAGNTSASNVATGDETLTGATITQLHWSCSGSERIDILRGANTILKLSGTFSLDCQQHGIALSEFPAANLVIQFSGSNSSVIVELSKVSDKTTP